MHLLIVTFNLENASAPDYRRSCDDEAPAFAAIPGLISKLWLADESTNTYGGVYTFIDRDALDAYTRSELFKSIADDPTITNLATSVFEVLESPSRVTHGLVGVAA